MLQETMTSGKLSIRRVAKKAGLDHVFLSRVLKGEKRLPLRRVESLANALGLEGEERRRFLLTAHLDRASPLVRKYVAELEMIAKGSSRL